MTMSISLSAQNELQLPTPGIVLNCPHCQTLSHISFIAAPKFEDLSRYRPERVGMVFRCDACAEPVFLKFTVRAWSASKIDFAPAYTEIERPRESFPLTYLPKEAEAAFKEALACYSAGCFNAFAAMSRLTAQSLFRELGERGKLDLFDTLQEIRELAELDDESFGTFRTVLFGSDTDPWPHQPSLDAEHAGILLEVMRDLLYQTFVRKARLMQAMTFRRFVVPAQNAAAVAQS
jgi:hypothetical protein